MATFVTGGTGFIGSWVVRALVNKGESVSVLARQESDLKNLRGLPVNIVYGDVVDSDCLRKHMRGIKHVVHLAADYRLWARNAEAMRAINVDGAKNVLTIAAEMRVNKIVHTSTVATIGLKSSSEPATEQDIVCESELIGSYKKTKFDAERIAFDLAEKGAPITIVNPSTPVGSLDLKPTPTGKMIRDASRGLMPAFVDTGLNIVDVRDVADGILLALEKGQRGERYILGGENISLRRLLEKIALLANRKPATIALPRAPLYPIAFVLETAARMFDCNEPAVTIDKLRMSKKKMYFSSKKAEQELGYRHRPIDDALFEAVKYYCPLVFSPIQDRAPC